MCQWSIKLNHCVVGSEIIYSIEVFKSNLCDYNDTCILVRGNIKIIRRGQTTTSSILKLYTIH